MSGITFGVPLHAEAPRTGPHPIRIGVRLEPPVALRAGQIWRHIDTGREAEILDFELGRTGLVPIELRWLDDGTRDQAIGSDLAYDWRFVRGSQEAETFAEQRERRVKLALAYPPAGASREGWARVVALLAEGYANEETERLRAASVQAAREAVEAYAKTGGRLR